MYSLFIFGMCASVWQWEADVHDVHAAMLCGHAAFTQEIIYLLINNHTPSRRHLFFLHGTVLGIIYVFEITKRNIGCFHRTRHHLVVAHRSRSTKPSFSFGERAPGNEIDFEIGEVTPDSEILEFAKLEACFWFMFRTSYTCADEQITMAKGGNTCRKKR